MSEIINSHSFLQHYWWTLVAVLGALLVFLMFVQGANALILFVGKNPAERSLMINSTGRKWELSFTTLVTFGGAFFASFPLFYSTSFSGAYWVWILLLLTFVFQAVSYEFQNKNGNLLGSKAFQLFLTINGVVAPLVVGAAVGTFFTGSDFVVNKLNMADPNVILKGGVISQWGTAWHGLEALTQPLCLALGATVLTLDLVLGCLYMLNNIEEKELSNRIRKYLLACTVAFLLALVATLVLLFTREGYHIDAEGVVSLVKYKYFFNLIQVPVTLVLFLLGAVLVVVGIAMGIFTKSVRGIWPSGIGTVLVVISIFFLAGLNNTPYYPSYADLQSSLSIVNSSSSVFTLKAMFFVSFAIPFVFAYIFYAWQQMDKKPITKEEIKNSDIKY